MKTFPSLPNDHPQAPETWICSDTFFTLFVNGVNYHRNGIAEGY